MKTKVALVLPIAIFLLGLFGFSVSANQAPTGNLDGATCDIIGGWAYDPDTSNDGIAINFYYEDAGQLKFLTDTFTSGQRSDVNSILGITGNHGFTISTPDILKDGQSRAIHAYAIDSDPSHSMNAELAFSPKTIRCIPAIGTFSFTRNSFEVTYTKGEKNPEGQALEFTNTSETIINYTISVPNQPSWLNTGYSTDQLTSSPGQVTGLGALADPTGLDVGTYSTNIVLTGNFAGSPLSILVVLKILNQAPWGWLDGARCDIIGGWAYDPDSPNDVIAVHFYYEDNGTLKFLADTFTMGERPDVNSILGISGTHGYTILTPEAIKDGRTYKIHAYGIDSDPSHSLNAELLGSPTAVNCGNMPTPTPTHTTTPTPTVTITSPPSTTSPPAFNIADINQDGKVNRSDYDILIANFGKIGPNDADLNGDRKVDIFDYNEMVENYGQ